MNHASLCARPRIARKMRLASRRRIVVVHGRPGCGKSFALGRHFAGLREPWALFCPRAEHDGVAAFARGLAEALAAVAPGIVRLLPFAFASARRQPDPWDTIALWFAGQLDAPMVVGVDELHRLDDEATLAFLARLVDATPPKVRWAFGTRSTAALPLPRWLASGWADASVDEIALRVEAQEVPEFAAWLHAAPAFVDSLRTLHDGSIGAIVDGVAGADTVWRRFAGRPEHVMALAALPEIDPALLAHLPPETVALFDEMNVALPAVCASSGARQLDEGVRTRAYAIAHANGGGAVDRGTMLAARAVEAAGRTRQALQLYVSARAHDDVARILALHGFELHERGAADVVAAAISSLPPEARRSSAIALMLEATDESFRGRYDVSESWFEQALRLARDERQRLRVDVAFALELLRRGRADAFERLEALAPLAADDAASVVILASLATAHAAAGRLRQAETCIAEALNALPNVDDVAIRATVHQRSAFVALSAGDVAAAEHHANTAATLAAEHGNDELVAVARSVSYVVAVSYRDDQARALEALRHIAIAGARLGSAIFRRFALIGTYLIHAERCDARALAALDVELAGEEIEASMQHVEEGLLPARALRLCWRGEFEAAHQLLAFSAGRQPTPESQALRWAEVAVYAAAAGRESSAAGAVAKAQEELAAPCESRSVETLRANLLVVLALLMLGRNRQAALALERATPYVERWPRWGALAAFLRTAAHAGTCDPEYALALIDEMHAAGLGGWARMVAQIPGARLALPLGA